MEMMISQKIIMNHFTKTSSFGSDTKSKQLHSLKASLGDIYTVYHNLGLFIN